MTDNFNFVLKNFFKKFYATTFNNSIMAMKKIIRLH